MRSRAEERARRARVGVVPGRHLGAVSAGPQRFRLTAQAIRDRPEALLEDARRQTPAVDPVATSADLPVAEREGFEPPMDAITPPKPGRTPSRIQPLCHLFRFQNNARKYLALALGNASPRGTALAEPLHRGAHRSPRRRARVVRSACRAARCC